MAAGPHMTLQTRLVLRAFLSEPAQSRYAREICDLAKLPHGSVYPVLAGLELCGCVESGWDDRLQGPPRRRVYRLSRDGAEQARAALTRVPDRVPARRRWIPGLGKPVVTP